MTDRRAVCSTETFIDANKERTAEQVLADVNAALAAADWLYDQCRPAPDRIVIPVRNFWEMLQYPLIAKIKRRRRPTRFTRRLGYGWERRRQ